MLALYGIVSGSGLVRNEMLQLIDRYFIKKPLIRRFVTKLIAGDREQNVTLLARDYLVHTLREHGLFRASRLARTCSLFRDEVPVLIHLAGLLCDGDTFLDIGANIGLFAVNIASLRTLFPDLKIYAFEPNLDTAARLRANAEPLGIEVFEIALSDRNGTLEFVDGAASSVFSTVENTSAYSISSERSVCECRRLEDMPIQGQSIVMKIDVEGHEWEVLQGAIGLFQANRVRALYLDDFKDARVMTFLGNYKFRYFNGRTLEPATDQTRHLLAIKT
jgi:FkbM family methyltransferase